MDVIFGVEMWEYCGMWMTDNHGIELGRSGLVDRFASRTHMH